MVSADVLTAPDSVRIAGYISSHNQIGVWWINPTDTDFAGTQVWFDYNYIGTTTPSTKFYYAEFLSVGYHIFSTRTIDTFGNINPTWVNLTAYNGGYLYCNEEWFADDYCYVPPTPTPTKFPTDPANVTFDQSPTQMSNQYTDVIIFYILMIATLLFLLLSRNIDVKTIRPMMFAVISFLTSITMTWASLSIAYLGNFVPGAILEYTNQTNVQIYQYQLIQVVATPWITALCIAITILVIVNAVDVGLRYLQRYDELDRYDKEGKREKIKIF
jgi:hypothetical protein